LMLPALKSLTTAWKSIYSFSRSAKKCFYTPFLLILKGHQHE
jgi:hypothetical protein